MFKRIALTLAVLAPIALPAVASAASVDDTTVTATNTVAGIGNAGFQNVQGIGNGGLFYGRGPTVKTTTVDATQTVAGIGNLGAQNVQGIGNGGTFLGRGPLRGPVLLGR